MNTATLALIGTISAVQLSREPLLANSASKSHPELEIFQFPEYHKINIDYPVPDFGVSHEVRYTQNNIKEAEKAAKHKWTVAPDAAWPAGVDTEVEFKLLQTDSEIEREPLLSRNAKESHPELEIFQFPEYHKINIDYPVPDFGVSHEVRYTQNNIKMAEAASKHKWTVAPGAAWPAGVDTEVEFKLLQLNAEREPLLSADASPLEIHQSPAYSSYPVDYKVADFGLSHEILYTQNNIKKAETSLKHPLVSSFGATDSPVNPRNYPVADFGLDRDIQDSLKDLESQEKIHGQWSVNGSESVTNAKKEITKASSGSY